MKEQVTDLHILDQVDFEIDMAELMEKLHVKPGSDNADRLEKFVEKAKSAAKPKAIYRVGFIEERNGDNVVVNGVTLTSRVLSVNLEKVNRIFAYVASCGTELDDWAASQEDLLDRFWADSLMGLALDAAIDAVGGHIKNRYQPGKVGFMAPGSLEDWPLSQQNPLFEIVGDTRKTIGVELLESMLMKPVKTISEIMFQNDENFKSCRLWPREACPSREAPYDSTLYNEKYK